MTADEKCEELGRRFNLLIDQAQLINHKVELVMQTLSLADRMDIESKYEMFRTTYNSELGGQEVIWE